VVTVEVGRRGMGGRMGVWRVVEAWIDGLGISRCMEQATS
jgi:hypothetical protein